VGSRVGPILRLHPVLHRIGILRDFSAYKRMERDIFFSVKIDHVLNSGAFSGFGTGRVPVREPLEPATRLRAVHAILNVHRQTPVEAVIAVQAAVGAALLWLGSGMSAVTSSAIGLSLAAADYALGAATGSPFLLNRTMLLIARALHPRPGFAQSCVHEAGHFCVGYVYGQRILSVQVYDLLSQLRANDGCGGRVKTMGDALDEKLLRSSDDDLLKRASLCMGGIAAEHMHAHDGHGGSNDLGQVAKLLHTYRPSWSATERADFVVAAFHDASRVLTTHRALMDTLVSELESNPTPKFGACCSLLAAAYDESKRKPDIVATVVHRRHK